METLATVQANVLATLYPFTARKDVRYYLDGVYLEPVDTGGLVAVATDGHRMLIINDLAGHCSKPIIVQFASTLATQLKRKDAGIATISRISPDNNSLQISLENGFAGPAVLIDGTYPAYEQVMPKGLNPEPCGQQHYNSEYVAGFCTAEKVLRSDNKQRGISIVNGDQKSPGCVLFPFISDTLHARGVLMPLTQKEAHLYTWNPPIHAESMAA
jgi:hypothetical protein